VPAGRWTCATARTADARYSRDAVVATVTSVSKVCLRKMLESNVENAGAATMHHCGTRLRGGGNLIQLGLASSAAALSASKQTLVESV
jgi:hypothetical protein